jgi:hypothetical protein
MQYMMLPIQGTVALAPVVAPVVALPTALVESALLAVVVLAVAPEEALVTCRRLVAPLGTATLAVS